MYIKETCGYRSAFIFHGIFSRVQSLDFEVSGVEVTGAITQNIQGPDLITGGTFGFEGSVIATLLMLIAIVLLHYKYQEESN